MRELRGCYFKIGLFTKAQLYHGVFSDGRESVFYLLDDETRIKVEVVGGRLGGR
jgi:hypothetical protein